MKTAMTEYSVLHVSFADKVTLDPITKEVISVRDGVHEYYGSEIGIEPAGKLFQIFRARATVEAIAGQMNGLPVTMGHVELTDTILESLICGRVLDSVLEEHTDPETNSTVKVKNKIDLFKESTVNPLSMG